MAFNRIQFQRGISLPEFMNSFGTEEQCAVAVNASRWPNGFRCPCCECAQHWVVGHGTHKLFQCQACRHQAPLTSGSIFERIKLPLRIWFLALYFISQAKTGLAALALPQAPLWRELPHCMGVAPQDQSGHGRTRGHAHACRRGAN